MDSAHAHAGLPGLPGLKAGRKATWFELFFDLVFVVAVAQLSAAYAQDYHGGGALRFVAFFLAMWWCWLGATFHATRFDEDRPVQRLVGFGQVLAVVLLGYGASDPMGERAWAFGGGVMAFKLLLALAYGLERSRWPGARGLCQRYVAVYVAQAALWGSGIALGGELRLLLWGLALLLDIGSPFLVARFTHEVPPHPEHLPERFGLFTIILLGEGMAASVHALDHGPELHASALGVSLLGALISFGLWLGYFEWARGHAERHIDRARAGRQMRQWAYAHIPLYLGIASLAAGTVALASHPSPGAMGLYGAGVVCAVLGLAGVARSRRQDPGTH